MGRREEQRDAHGQGERESARKSRESLRWSQAFRRACGVSCGGQGGRSERSFGRSPDTGKV